MARIAPPESRCSPRYLKEGSARAVPAASRRLRRGASEPSPPRTPPQRRRSRRSSSCWRAGQSIAAGATHRGRRTCTSRESSHLGLVRDCGASTPLPAGARWPVVPPHVIRGGGSISALYRSAALLNSQLHLRQQRSGVELTKAYNALLGLAARACGHRVAGVDGRQCARASAWCASLSGSILRCSSQ